MRTWYCREHRPEGIPVVLDCDCGFHEHGLIRPCSCCGGLEYVCECPNCGEPIEAVAT